MKPPYVWTYDPIAKAGYLKLSNGAVERTIELIEGLNLDIEEDGSVHGIEVLQAKHQPSKSDEVAEAVQKLRTEEPLYIGKTQYEFYEGDVRWVYNQALDDLITGLTPHPTDDTSGKSK